MSSVTRRRALAIGAACSVAAACSTSESPRSKRVAVIGAGIIGASIAYHLAKEGAAVTVFDRGDIANRASRGTFAWLNASWAKQPRHYHRLNQLGLAGWQELERELYIPIKWGGSLEWFEGAERQQRLAMQIKEQTEWGEPARMVELDELRRLEPNVDYGAAPTAAISPNDGALDPVAASKLLLASAVKMGAKVEINCAVNGVSGPNPQGVTVLQTDKGPIKADAYVLATGADPNATATLAGVEIPQRSTPGVIVVTKPVAPVLNRIIVAPGVHIHQRIDGRVVLGDQDGPPQTEAHAARLEERPTRFPNAALADAHAQRILSVAAQYCPALRSAEVEHAYIGWRPLPLDGHPVMGFSPSRPQAYLAISHSGVSLAPILGRLASQEILEGISAGILAPYRPDRSFAEVRRY